jgi:thiamine-monophosphate kinase
VTSQRLVDLGEQGILSSIVFPSIARSAAGAGGLGDDCAVVEVPMASAGTSLVATVDPCPQPLAFDLFDPDYWHFGWMTMVINLSDLASMGADPAGILISTVMPNDMLADDYRRFWYGVIDASDEWSCRILGGNIKDGPSFSAEGAAFGWCANQSVMRRTGSSDGDLVYVIGDLGSFWSAVLYKQRAHDLSLSGAEEEQLRRALYRPTPRIKEGKELAASGLVTACMDASDGVLGALAELGRVNKLDVCLAEFEPSSLVNKVTSRLGLPPLKLMLSWGDWQLVVTVRKEKRAEFENLAQSFDAPVTLIGKMKPGSGCVRSQAAGPARQLANLSSERFTKTSYFTYGTAEEFVDWFMQAPLFVS